MPRNSAKINEKELSSQSDYIYHAYAIINKIIMYITQSF